MPITIPPLRERREDILPFVEHFIAHYNQKLNRSIKGVTPKAEALLISYNWTGNIREMRNVIERAMILCAGDKIHARDLPLGGSEFYAPVTSEHGDEFLSLEELERLHIERILAATERNHTRAAEILGVTRTTLYNKLAKYNLASE